MWKCSCDPNGSTVFDWEDDNPTETIDGDECCGGNITFAPDGSIIPWINSGPDTTRYNNTLMCHLQLPQESFTAATFGHCDITDTVELKVKAVFTSNQVPQELAPSPFFSTVTNPYNN